jgi:hypothetical protein
MFRQPLHWPVRWELVYDIFATGNFAAAFARTEVGILRFASTN